MPTWVRYGLRAFNSLISRGSAILWLRQCNDVGRGTQTFSRPHIENRGRIDIGRDVRLNSRWVPIEIVTGPEGRVTIADGVYVNYGTLIGASGALVRIGANVMIGNYSIIADTEIPGADEPEPRPAMSPRPVEIGENAWLAARVTVLPGSRIGAGAIIGAGSVVAGEIPAGAIAGGVPARILRTAPRPGSTEEPGRPSSPQA